MKMKKLAFGGIKATAVAALIEERFEVPAERWTPRSLVV